jgi:hypothetical protein
MPRLILAAFISAFIASEAHAQSFEAGGIPLDAETLTDGLEHPWGIDFLPDGAAIVTERPGRMRIFADGALSWSQVRAITSAARRLTIEERGVRAVVGYTQRFRRRFITARQRIQEGAIGDVTTVVTRAFMNRMVPIATLARTDDRSTLTPMVVSGTHSLDACLWLLEGLAGKEPVEVYAKAGDKVLGEHGTKDNTLAIFTLADGSLWSMTISCALPQTCPGSVYGLEIGIVGTTGVIDIEDTHRDLVLADPPYSVEDSAHYGTTMISRNKVMRALEGLTPGAHVVWLDQVLPMYKKAAFEPEAVIGMWKSTNHRFRGITVFKRISSH